LPNVLDRAMRTAMARRSVTAVIVPADVQELDYSAPEHAFKMVPSSLGMSHYAPVPADPDIERAAEVLNAGEKVAVLIGQGARGARQEVMEVADRLGAGVAKALLGKDALDDDLPYVTGSIGLLGTRPSYELMQDCDTLLVIGSSFPYTQFLPEFGQARAVQIDIDPRNLSMRYPTDLPLTGDAAATLAALRPLLERKEDRSWQQEIVANVERWWHILEDRAQQAADPVNPQLVFHELSRRLPDGAILLADSGSATNWWARHLRLRRGMDAALSGTLATMGPAVPYALAAKLAYPDRPVIAALGDGAMQMIGINALIDLAKYRDRFRGPCVVCVLNNRDLNQVTWEQRVMEGEAKLPASQDLPDFPYARYAELIGVTGVRVERPEDLGPAWDRVLAADGPAVLEVVTDPDVPPLPPHIRLEQAKGMAKAIYHGDPDRGGTIREALKGKLAEFATRS
jgi:pyruvate dehydrogenase (quinone)